MANQLGYNGEQDFIFNGNNLTKLYGWRVLTVDIDTSFVVGYNRSIDIIKYNNTCVLNKIESNNIPLTVSIVKEGATLSDIDLITSKIFKNDIAQLKVRTVREKNAYATGVFTSCEATQYSDDATLLLLNFETVLPYLVYNDVMDLKLSSNSENISFRVKDNIAKTFPTIIIKPYVDGAYFSIENKTNGSRFYTGKLKAGNTYVVNGELKQYYIDETKQLIYNKNWCYLDNDDYNSFDYTNELILYGSHTMDVQLIVENEIGFI